ncbi:undecaprenyl/decaprenyl-phosphate alpha-N-acetylglucosaminyl 1-phosphate transferase [bacterium]|nr:MAG: undecaprenyl/decaprenyl-phosphate alpha-N-acetylglucosaminyl 1-phosphate transferase [bacterium]
MFLNVKGSPLAALAIAALVALLCTMPVRALAFKMGALAYPGGRRTHSEPMAQWGGLAIFIAVLCAAIVWRQPGQLDFRQLAPSAAATGEVAQRLHLTSTFLGCGFLMLVLGMADDKWELSPVIKFGGQLLIASLLWFLGVKITTLPFTDGTFLLGAVPSYFLTVFWVLGLTNGVNLIDGVDGLAAGVCAIAAGSLCLIELPKAPWAAGVSAALCGACLGFLRFNFHPAKIYLGDTGSLLIGFWLATISLTAAAKTAAATTLILPLVVMGIPVLDTVWAIWRRARARQPIWRGDRGHLHHRLLNRGLSPVKTVLVLYACGVFLGGAAWAWSRWGVGS